MAISHNPDRADVLESGYASKLLSITDAAEVKAVCGVSALEGRQLLYLENTGPNVVYFGPSGVTPAGVGRGGKLYPEQHFWISLGASIDIYLITDTGESASVVVQEYA